MSTERIAKCSATGAYPSPKMREVQINLSDGEVRDKVEHYEPFGFTSEPVADGKNDALAVFTDESRGLGMVICIADRRYKPTNLKPGEVCVYDKKGRKVYFKEDGILIEGVDDPITINTTSKVVVNAPTVQINASSITQITSPETTISGHVTVKGGLNVSGGSGAQVDGTISASGDITAGTISVQNHVHGGVQSGGSTTDKAQ